MKNLKKVLHLFVIASVLTTFSCTKEGKQGVAGVDGKNGNANVTSSTIVISGSQWFYQAPSYLIDLSYSTITTDVINNGAVLIYYSANGTGFEQLPTTLYFFNNVSTTINAVASVGNVRLAYTDSDLTQPQLPFVMTIKVVVIPSAQRLANPNIDYTNYYEVKGAFNLK